MIRGYKENTIAGADNYFSSMDIHFGHFIASFGKENKEDLFLAAALVSRSVRDGHICLDLNSLAGRIIFKSDDGKTAIECPPLNSWIAALKSAPCVGCPGDFKPLILDEKARLYLQRYWHYEKDVADYILSNTAPTNEIKLDKLELQKKLNLYFDEKTQQKINWQKVAATAALLKKFLIISGSPGTGKTTTISKIMALILDVEDKSWRIALAAPTGKAAARLQESVKKTKEKLNCAAFIKETIPNEAKTIHRLLGTISNSPYFQFNEKNPLPYDLVVIDEASMVDLPLIAKLIAALPKEARLILLGDKDQLASVDAGVVLGDICNQGSPNIFSEEFARQISNLSGEEIESDDIPAGIQDSIIHLRENYRFPGQSGIGLLSQLVKNGEAQEALRLLRSGKYNDIHWIELNKNTRSLKTFSDAVINGYSEYLKLAKSGGNHEKIFNLYENFRILCALRVGIWGTERISEYIEKILNDAGLIDTGDIFLRGTADYDLAK